MKDLAPILGSEEYGSFPVVENLPPNNWEILQKQITNQAYDRTVNKYNDQERMMKEAAYSEVEKHHSLVDHIKKDTLARALASGAILLGLIDLGLLIKP